MLKQDAITPLYVQLRDEIEKDIINRDHQDMTREISPLKQAEDAVLIDSSHMTVEEAVDAVVALLH